MKRKVQTSKFIRLYGMTLEQVARSIKTSPYKAYLLHLQNKIKLTEKHDCPYCQCVARRK